MDMPRRNRTSLFIDIYEEVEAMSFTLGIITARGGSKGIKNKNIIQLCKKPLIHYTIEAAQKAKTLDDFILSTDDQNIADCAAEAGLVSHGLRPAHLATDHAKSNDVILYEVKHYEERTGQAVGSIMLLQPTAPMRTSYDIDAAANLFSQEQQKSLISCYSAESIHPQIMYQKNGLNLSPFLEQGKTIIRRQDMQPVYIRNGAIYLTEAQYFETTGNLVCESPLLYEMSRKNSINIDTLEDLELATFYLNRQGT